jgi:hypothetical protein
MLRETTAEQLMRQLQEEMRQTWLKLKGQME